MTDSSAKNSTKRIDTERSVIAFSTSNFLDQQLMEGLKGCIENNEVNDVQLLRHLNSIASGKTVLDNE